MPEKISKIPEDCPGWLAHWIGTSDGRFESIDKTIISFDSRMDIIEVTTTEILTKLNSSLFKNKPSNTSNKVTFKWVLEKFAIPALMLLGGYLIAK